MEPPDNFTPVSDVFGPAGAVTVRLIVTWRGVFVTPSVVLETVMVSAYDPADRAAQLALTVRSCAALPEAGDTLSHPDVRTASKLPMLPPTVEKDRVCASAVDPAWHENVNNEGFTTSVMPPVPITRGSRAH